MYNKPKDDENFYFKTDVFYPGGMYKVPQNSWKLTAWVAKHSNLKGSAKLVAIQIASHYNHSNRYAHPSYDSLQESTGMGHGTVARGIKEMKLSGEWLVLSTVYRDSARKTNNRYFPLSPLNGEVTDGIWKPKKHNSIKEYNEWLNQIRRIWRNV